MDYGRDETEIIVKDTLNEFWDKAIAASKAFENQVSIIARQYGIDPTYLMHILLSGAANWEDAAGASKDALWVTRKAYIHNPNKRSERKPPVLPDTMEGELKVNAAIKAVADWCKGTFFSSLDAIFTKLVHKAAREIAAVEGISPRAGALEFINLAAQATQSRPHWFRDMLSLSLYLKHKWIRG